MPARRRARRRWRLVGAASILIGLSACGPTAAEQCEDAPECLEDGECLEDCLEHRARTAECCDCLAELDCLGDGLGEDRCTENLVRGGSISVVVDCAEDDGRCGTVCGSLRVEPEDG